MNCEHPSIRKIMTGELKGGTTMQLCLVAHYFDDGSIKPPCWRCKDCGRWISFEEREKMKEKEQQ